MVILPEKLILTQRLSVKMECCNERREECLTWVGDPRELNLNSDNLEIDVQRLAMTLPHGHYHECVTWAPI